MCLSPTLQAAVMLNQIATLGLVQDMVLPNIRSFYDPASAANPVGFLA